MCNWNEKVCKILLEKCKVKMINFDDYANENKTEHKENWPHIPDHPYRILMIGGNKFIIKFNRKSTRH